MCDNKVIQYVERGFRTLQSTMKCGSTGQYGDVLLCDSCQEKADEKYPQGWRNYPGDICEHGVYIGDPYGPDIICGLCE